LIFEINSEDYVVPETGFTIVLENRDYTHTFSARANPITNFFHTLRKKIGALDNKTSRFCVKRLV
jgi:hypothetical protein